MKKTTSFTEGKIMQPMILFAHSADVSAVSTGSQIMMTLTNLISSFAMGTTILLGQQIGSGKRKTEVTL